LEWIGGVVVDGGVDAGFDGVSVFAVFLTKKVEVVHEIGFVVPGFEGSVAGSVEFVLRFDTANFINGDKLVLPKFVLML
jgi:hypothetical protein